jgi:hypothetical protein
MTQQMQLFILPLFIIMNLIHILQWTYGILESHARSDFSVLTLPKRRIRHVI